MTGEWPWLVGNHQQSSVVVSVLSCVAEDGGGNSWRLFALCRRHQGELEQDDDVGEDQPEDLQRTDGGSQ